MNLQRLGRVANAHSNFLSLLVVDGQYAGAWGGPSRNDDFKRAVAAEDAGRCQIAVGDGQGVVASIGGCGISEVHRAGDTLVMVEHYQGDDAFAVSPDGTKLVLRIKTETVVLAYPSSTQLAKFDEYCNHDCIAFSSDSKWLAVSGQEVHVYELESMRHVATFRPPSSPWTKCFTPDGRLVTGDDTGTVRLYEPQTGAKLHEVDAAMDRKRKPTSRRSPPVRSTSRRRATTARSWCSTPISLSHARATSTT